MSAIEPRPRQHRRWSPAARTLNARPCSRGLAVAERELRAMALQADPDTAAKLLERADELRDRRRKAAPR